MRATRTLPSLALAGVLALGTAACGGDAEPAGESGEEGMTEDMTEDMTEEEMDDDMGDDEMTDEG